MACRLSWPEKLQWGGDCKPVSDEDVVMGLEGDAEDEQARYMEATINGFRVATIYLPNGNPAPGPNLTINLAGWRVLKPAPSLC